MIKYRLSGTEQKKNKIIYFPQKISGRSYFNPIFRLTR